MTSNSGWQTDWHYLYDQQRERAEAAESRLRALEDVVEAARIEAVEEGLSALRAAEAVEEGLSALRAALSALDGQEGTSE